MHSKRNLKFNENDFFECLDLSMARFPCRIFTQSPGVGEFLAQRKPGGKRCTHMFLPQVRCGGFGSIGSVHVAVIGRYSP
ncbi:hypothetical protein [Streptomyces sp. RB110-2]|uniref:hypothetical protein n=1 Tax=Streptomyces sp. RB110-2 TaxID=2794863 RepID=UPI0018FF97E2|nr:hypothetical protein [Streptomyces sp. RB110-2]